MCSRQLSSIPLSLGQSPFLQEESALAQLQHLLEGELEGIQAAGTWKSERVITSKQGPHVQFQGGQGDILNFCASSYLGLSSHPEVIQAGLDALEKYGAGLSSVRFICGTQFPQHWQPFHVEFEMEEEEKETEDPCRQTPFLFKSQISFLLSDYMEKQRERFRGWTDLEDHKIIHWLDRGTLFPLDIHKELEEKIARFHQREDAILYASCFDANAGIFEALLTPEDAILSDELNHASIIRGIRLCKANRYRYKHMDMQDLEAKLQDSQKCRLRMVVTDGAFSMDGDIAPLEEICSLSQKYKAIVFVDDCHATGFLGPNGRGTDELLGVMDQVTIINSALGKALGGAAGGYTTGPKALIDLLRQRSRPYLFSNSLPPAVVACVSKALDLVMESNTIAQPIAAKTTRFRSKMEAAGFTILGHQHPICPVMLGDTQLASIMADDMLKRGIYVVPFSYPVVPKGKARIRVVISAVHSEEDIDRCVEAFIEVGRKHGALP